MEKINEFCQQTGYKFHIGEVGFEIKKFDTGAVGLQAFLDGGSTAYCLVDKV